MQVQCCEHRLMWMVEMRSLRSETRQVRWEKQKRPKALPLITLFHILRMLIVQSMELNLTSHSSKILFSYLLIQKVNLILNFVVTKSFSMMHLRNVIRNCWITVMKCHFYVNFSIKTINSWNCIYKLDQDVTTSFKHFVPNLNHPQVTKPIANLIISSSSPLLCRY